MGDAAAIRNFKDFLQLYNKLTETCFRRCVTNIHSRVIEPEEAQCVEACCQKFIFYNNKLMQNFIRAQSEIMDRRMKEMEEQQRLAEGNQEQTATNISIVAN